MSVSATAFKKSVYSPAVALARPFPGVARVSHGHRDDVHRQRGCREHQHNDQPHTPPKTRLHRWIPPFPQLMCDSALRIDRTPRGAKHAVDVTGRSPSEGTSSPRHPGNAPPPKTTPFSPHDRDGASQFPKNHDTLCPPPRKSGRCASAGEHPGCCGQKPATADAYAPRSIACPATSAQVSALAPSAPIWYDHLWTPSQGQG